MSMTLISTVTVGAGSTSARLDFNSIPQTATDLLLVWSLRLSGTGSDGNPWTQSGIKLNNIDFASSGRQLLGNGSSASTDGNLYPGFATDTNATSSTYSSGQVYIPNYALTAAKSGSVDVVTENNATASLQVIQSSFLSTTTAVSSMSLVPITGLYDQYSSASLYSITKGSGGATVP